MDTDKQMVSPILFAHYFGCQNLRLLIPIYKPIKTSITCRGFFDFTIKLNCPNGQDKYLKMGQPRHLSCLVLFFSKLQTRIVGVEGEHADHLTTTTMTTAHMVHKYLPECHKSCTENPGVNQAQYLRLVTAKKVLYCYPQLSVLKTRFAENPKPRREELVQTATEIGHPFKVVKVS